MFKKIMKPIDELNYRSDGIDTKYILNEGERAIGMFAAAKNMIVPTQISPQNVSFFILEGTVEISLEDKYFVLHAGELLLIPKTSAYSIKFPEDAKALFMRL